MSASNHDWKSHLNHVPHYLMHTETGKRATQAVVATAVAAVPLLAPAAAVVVPVVVVGAAAYALWRWLK